MTRSTSQNGLGTILLIVAFAGLGAAVGHADAAITYSLVNYPTYQPVTTGPAGNITFTWTVTTDGVIGVLGEHDVIGETLNWVGPGVNYSLYEGADGNMEGNLDGAVASSTQITLPPGNDVGIELIDPRGVYSAEIQYANDPSISYYYYYLGDVVSDAEEAVVSSFGTGNDGYHLAAPGSTWIIADDGQSVPEPASITLLAFGGLGLLARRRGTRR